MFDAYNFNVRTCDMLEYEALPGMWPTVQVDQWLRCGKRWKPAWNLVCDLKILLLYAVLYCLGICTNLTIIHDLLVATLDSVYSVQLYSNQCRGENDHSGSWMARSTFQSTARERKRCWPSFTASNWDNDYCTQVLRQLLAHWIFNIQDGTDRYRSVLCGLSVRRLWMGFPVEHWFDGADKFLVASCSSTFLVPGTSIFSMMSCEQCSKPLFVDYYSGL